MTIQSLLKRAEINCMLVTKPENVRYLTGFIGSFGQAVVTKSKTYLITDPRYTLQAKKMCEANIEVMILENYEEDLKKILNRHKCINIGIEDTHITYASYIKLKKILKGYKLKAIGNELDHLRIIKSDEEIKIITKSQRINEKALHQAIRLLKPGITEKELAWKIVSLGHELGAEEVSFDPIVAFGKNSASPHYNPSDYKYKKTESVLIDMGFKYKGYCSDMTRTFLPKKASNQLASHYNLVLKAQENCITNLRASHKGSHGDQLSRQIFENEGLAEFFTHANGHGVGLEIHEAPSLSSKQKHKDRTMKLEENMVVTVEPGIYLEGKYGIRIEDMIVIGKDKNKNLTKFPKKIENIIIR